MPQASWQLGWGEARKVLSISPFFSRESTLRPAPLSHFPRLANLLWNCSVWILVVSAKHSSPLQVETQSPTVLQLYLLFIPINLQCPMLWGLVSFSRSPGPGESGSQTFFSTPLCSTSPPACGFGMGVGLGFWYWILALTLLDVVFSFSPGIGGLSCPLLFSSL